MKLYLIAAFLLATLVAVPCLAEENVETAEQDEPVEDTFPAEDGVEQEKRYHQLDDRTCSIIQRSCKNFCKPTPSKTFILCEHRRGVIRCPSGRRIKISYANYGRTGRYRCPNPAIRTTRCISLSSALRIRSACKGRTSCALHASNSVYGDPCYGTFKYIEVKYQCTLKAWVFGN